MHSRRPAAAPRGAQRTASGNMARQGAAPYARPGASHTASYPPSQISIRGASSLPTQVLVANLARGTSAEDIRQTFLQFGEIIRVKERRQNDAQAVAYEVLFEDKPAAKKAVEQLDGALADGRILSVVIEGGDNVPTAPAAAQAAPPTGPRNNGRRGGEAAAAAATAPGRRELITPALAAKQAVQAAAAAAVPAVIPRGPRNANGNRAGGHQQQVMTARDRKAIAAAAHQGATAAALAAAAGRAGKAATPVGPANKGKGPAMTAAPSLASRLGGLPLAQRLGDVKGATNGAGSDLTNLEAKKTKRAAKKAAATAAVAAPAAAATTGAAPTTTTNKRRRGGKKGPKSSTEAAAANGSSSGGMELD